MGRRASTCHLLLIPPVCYAVIIFIASLEVACLMMSEPYTDAGDDDDDSGPAASQNSDCELQDCLELYQAAQDSMQTRHEGSSYRHHSGSAAADSRTTRCTVLRTFFSCIRNMSRSCLGDLTFHSSHRVVQKQMRDLNCSQRGPVFRPPVAIPPIAGGFLGSSDGTGNSMCIHRKAASHQFCTVYGDPHLKTFDGIHQTCRIIGAFPMFDNEFLSIQVTSEAINNAGASAIAKVTVVIKQHGECISERYVTYQANSPDPLPSTFENGLSSFGSADAVRLIDVIAGQHIEIVVRHADTTVIVRQTGRYFSVGVRVPVDILQGSSALMGTQLCTRKCPAAERLSMNSLEPSFVFSVADATNICRRHKLIDSFLDACIFDLVASGGDRNFSAASVHALNDFRRMVPAGSLHLSNRTHIPSTSSSSTSLLPCISKDYLTSSIFVMLLYLCWAWVSYFSSGNSFICYSSLPLLR